MATFTLDVTPLSLEVSALGVDITRTYALRTLRLRLSTEPRDGAIFFSSGTLEVLTPLTAVISTSGVRIALLRLVELPSLIPEVGSEFTPPGHKITQSRTQQGNTTRRIWASIPSDGRLKVDFRYVDDDDAEAVRAAWTAARGRFSMLRVPVGWFAGLSGDLLEVYNLEGQRLRWSFAAAPEITSVNEGHSDVSVQLKARTALGYGALVNA